MNKKNVEMSNTPRSDSEQRGDFVSIRFARELERENAALRELLNEPYQFFRFGHKALMPWGKALDKWCKRAEKLGFKKA
jgi:hypothetical protein